MMCGAMVAAARVVVVNGDREWHCPNCDQKLAQIVGERVVIKTRDRLISMRSDVEPDQVCWRCGTTSVLRTSSVTRGDRVL